MRQVPYVKTIIGDTETPITVFQKYVGDKIGFLLESKSKENNRFSFMGASPKDMIRANDKQSAMEHLSKRFGLMDKVSNLDALWDVLSSLNRIEKISLIHSDELIAYEYGQKIMKLLIDYVHLKEITCTIR